MHDRAARPNVETRSYQADPKNKPSERTSFETFQRQQRHLSASYLQNKLQSSITTDRSAPVRRSALMALTHQPAPEDVALAVRALADVDPEVRQSAAMVIGASGDASLADALRKARAREKDPVVTYFYDKALKKLTRRARAAGGAPPAGLGGWASRPSRTADPRRSCG